LVVVSLLDVYPNADTGCLLMRQQGVSFLCLTAIADHVDAVARLEARLAIASHDLGDRYHAFGLGANVHDNIFVGQLYHGPFLDMVIGGSGSFCGRLLSLKALQGSGEIHLLAWSLRPMLSAGLMLGSGRLWVFGGLCGGFNRFGRSGCIS